MDARTLEKRRRELYNGIPLLGRGIRRRAVAALAADGSAGAVQELAQAAVQSRDAVIRELALEAVSQVTKPSAINAVCEVWHETRHPSLGELLREKGWVATKPPEVRVTTALHVGALDLLRRTAAEIMGRLVAACGDAEPELAANARAVLRSLPEQPAREALCDFVIDVDHPAAREIALEAGYLPDDAARRALFLFLTEQWARYDALDFDQRLLRAAYEGAAEAIRRRVRENLRLTGRSDFLTIVAGHDYRARAAAMTPDELEFVLRMLQGQQAWERLWALALEIVPLWSARALGILARAGWQPPEADRAVFAQCAALAREELALDEAVMPQHFPQALLQAQLRAPGRINDVAFSPTDVRLAVATGARKVALWNYETAQTERALGGFAHSVGHVIFTASGKLVCAERTNVTAAPTGVYGWAGDGLFKLGEHQGPITGLATLTGDLALSAGRDAAVVVWDVAARAERARRVMQTWPRAVCASRAGDAALVLLQREFYRLSVPTLESGPWGRLNTTPSSAAFLPGNDAALIGRNNGYVLLYEVRRNQQWEQWVAKADQFTTQHKGAVVGIEVLPERGYFVTAGREGEVRFFDLAGRESLGQVVIPGGGVTALHVSPDGAFMAVGGADASFSLWDLRMPDVAALLRTPLGQLTPPAVGVLDACAHNPKLSLPAQRAVQFVAALVRHRCRFDIELETGAAHTIMAGEFDIEIE